MSRALIAFFCTGALLIGPAFGQMQKESALGDTLLNFFSGTKSKEAETVDRRVPFSSQEMQLSFSPLVRSISPSVVNVYASTRVQARSPFMADPFFERFFSIPQPPRVQSSLGSGVIVDASGIVVTNYHVINGADQVRVALSDGREFASRPLLQDEALDLAILKIEVPNSSKVSFPSANLGDSEALEVGDLVLALGNPFGVGQTTTSGIVSALARTLGGIGDFGYFIQTDAAINPGNSGGALVNMAGEVVGINSAIYSRSGGSIGIGFAIPSNLVRAVVDASSTGANHFERPYIGASLERVTPEISESLGMDRPSGALVTNVANVGPAQRAGLVAADIIIAVDDKRIDTPEELDYRLAVLPIGSAVQLTVLRNGKNVELKLPVELAPEGTGQPLQISGSGPFSGLTVTELSPALAQRLKLAISIEGVVITEIQRNSPSARVGFRLGDIIRTVDGEIITTAEQMKKIAEQDTRWWRFTIERDGRLIQQTLRF